MKTIHCYVCGKEVGFRGWANHVRMEKRIHGDDVYDILKLRRQNKEIPNEIIERIKVERKGQEFIDGKNWELEK